MFDADGITDDLGLLVLLTDRTGRVRNFNELAAARLGLNREGTAKLDLWDLTNADTARRLLNLSQAAEQVPARRVERITMRSRLGQRLSLTALVSVVPQSDQDPVIRIAGFDDGVHAEYVAALERAAELLTGFMDASTEAMWCIEYTEPVNLSAGEPEVVRQVFENECHWSMCNRAMARLYNLPDDLDFNRQRVSAYFRRSPENETFVRQLVEKSFHVDSAPSIDVRHDGSLAYVENSVRCYVVGGKMQRMWGTVRDTTEFRTAQNRIAQREREVREILSALPDAILVVDKTKRALAINPAFEATFGWRAGDVLGAQVTAIIDLESRASHDQRWFAPTTQRWITNVMRADGATICCDVRIAPMQDDEHRRFVISLRPELRRKAPEPKRRSIKSKRVSVPTRRLAKRAKT